MCALLTHSDTVSIEGSYSMQTYIAIEQKSSWILKPKESEFSRGRKKKGKSKIHPPIHGTANIGGKGSGISARSQKNTFLKLKKKLIKVKIEKRKKKKT